MFCMMFGMYIVIMNIMMEMFVMVRVVMNWLLVVVGVWVRLSNMFELIFVIMISVMSFMFMLKV